MSRLREAKKKILDELRLKISYVLCSDFDIANAIGATAQIDCSGGESFIHWHQKISGAQNASLGAKSFSDGVAERDARVFHGVMLVDVEIPADFEVEIECAVARE